MKRRVEPVEGKPYHSHSAVCEWGLSAPQYPIVIPSSSGTQRGRFSTTDCVPSHIGLLRLHWLLRGGRTQLARISRVPLHSMVDMVGRLGEIG